jgi:hypothetical protein
VASISQHVALLLDDDIFTARMLIPVVYDEDLHVWRDSLPSCRSRGGLLTLRAGNARGRSREKLTRSLRNLQRSA